MTYRIVGLSPGPFVPLYGLSDAALAERQAVRMSVLEQPGYPCRVTLQDCAVGTHVLLVNHVSHDAATPYRASHAIFVREGATRAAEVHHRVPDALDRRVLSLRAFNAAGMMTDAELVQPGEADPAIRRLLAVTDTHHVDAHNAVRGCFAARIDRA